MEKKNKPGRPATGQRTQAVSLSLEKSVLIRARKKHRNLSLRVTELLAADVLK